MSSYWWSLNDGTIEDSVDAGTFDEDEEKINMKGEEENMQGTRTKQEFC